MVLDDIQSLLVNQGLAISDEIFFGFSPDSPDECLVLGDYAAGPVEWTQDSVGPAIENPQIQFKLRTPAGAGMWEHGRQRIEKIYQFVSAIQNRTINGIWYREIHPIQSPFFLRRDEVQRNEFVFNARVAKQPTPPLNV